MNDMTNMPSGVEDPRTKAVALNWYIATQIATADPEFFEQYSGLILKTAEIGQVDEMMWILQVYIPKLEELRDAGRISSAEDAERGARRILSECTDLADMLGVSQRIAMEEMPKLTE